MALHHINLTRQAAKSIGASIKYFLAKKNLHKKMQEGNPYFIYRSRFLQKLTKLRVPEVLPPYTSTQAPSSHDSSDDDYHNMDAINRVNMKNANPTSGYDLPDYDDHVYETVNAQKSKQ